MEKLGTWWGGSKSNGKWRCLWGWGLRWRKRIWLFYQKNRPSPSSNNLILTLKASEAKWKTFLVKMSFICTKVRNHFINSPHINGFALSPPLKQRLWATRKWPIWWPRILNRFRSFKVQRIKLLLLLLKFVWRRLVISQWLQPQNKNINAYFQRIYLLGEEVRHERENKRRPKSLTENILMVWRQDGVSLCDNRDFKIQRRDGHENVA